MHDIHFSITLERNIQWKASVIFPLFFGLQPQPQQKQSFYTTNTKMCCEILSSYLYEHDSQPSRMLCGMLNCTRMRSILHRPELLEFCLECFLKKDSREVVQRLYTRLINLTAKHYTQSNSVCFYLLYFSFGVKIYFKALTKVTFITLKIIVRLKLGRITMFCITTVKSNVLD